MWCKYGISRDLSIKNNGPMIWCSYSGLGMVKLIMTVKIVITRMPSVKAVKVMSCKQDVSKKAIKIPTENHRLCE